MLFYCGSMPEAYKPALLLSMLAKAITIYFKSRCNKLYFVTKLNLGVEDHNSLTLFSWSFFYLFGNFLDPRM